MKYKVYYLTTEGVTSSVFVSQVYNYVLKMKNKVDIELFVIQNLKSRFRVSNFAYLFKRSLTFLPSVLGKKLITNIMLRKINNCNYSCVILHCRNPEAAYYGLLLKSLSKKSIRVVYDVRGYPEGEHHEDNNLGKAKYFKDLNSKLFRKVKYYNFVSSNLYNLYSEKYKINGSHIICPSAYDEEKFFIKEKVNNSLKDNNIGVVFIGGNQFYQNIEKIIDSVKDIKNINLLIITHKKLKYDASSITNLNFKFNLTSKQIRKECEGYDYGILWREKKSFNNVATPTKVGEYWGMGMKLIAVNSACSFEKTLKKNKKLGDLIDEDNLKDYLKKLEHLNIYDKIYINNYSIEHVSMSSNTEKYYKFYEYISSN